MLRVTGGLLLELLPDLTLRAGDIGESDLGGLGARKGLLAASGLILGSAVRIGLRAGIGFEVKVGALMRV